MNMRMMRERLPPGVKDGEQTDFGAKTFGGEPDRRLGRGAHQQGIDERLVLEGDLGGGGRQGEDEVEIGNRQQFGLARGEPCRPRRPLAFWTMPVAARVVGDARQAARVAMFDMPAERRRAVRQAAIAAMTRRSPRPTCPA